jgi:hypothetical protein
MSEYLSIVLVALLAAALGASSAWARNDAAPGGKITPQTAINLDGNYEETLVKTCISQPFCTLKFGVVESGKQFIVANASCSVFMTSGSLIYLYLGTINNTGSENLRRSFLTPMLIPSQTRLRFLSNNQLTKIYNTGEFPAVKAGNESGNTTFELTCTIAGAKFSP